jgi:hypothetical protein
MPSETIIVIKTNNVFSRINWRTRLDQVLPIIFLTPTSLARAVDFAVTRFIKLAMAISKNKNTHKS